MAGSENDDPYFTKLVEDCGALVVAETDDQTDLPAIAGFDLLKEHHLGKTLVRFYRKAAE